MSEKIKFKNWPKKVSSLRIPALNKNDKDYGERGKIMRASKQQFCSIK